MTDRSKLILVCNEIFGFLSSTENSHTQTLHITVLKTDIAVCKNSTAKKKVEINDYMISYKYEYHSKKAEVRLSRGEELLYEKKEEDNLHVSISI